MLQGRLAVPPHAADVAPFTALNSSTAGLLGDTVQMAVFRFAVWRYTWSSIVNSNFPVLAVAAMSLLVFWIPEALGELIDGATRLNVVPDAVGAEAVR